MEFKNFDEFIKYVKDISVSKEQIKFLCSYFLKQVDYPYARLFYDIIKVVQAKEKYKDKKINEIKDTLIHDLKKYLMPSDIIDMFIENDVPQNLLIQDIYQNFTSDKQRVDAFNLKYHGIATVFENGIIKKGICKDYSAFLKYVCDLIGLQCEVNHFPPPFEHAWISIMLDNVKYHFDLTYEKFIKDKFNNFDKIFHQNDWIFVKDEDFDNKVSMIRNIIVHE